MKVVYTPPLNKDSNEVVYIPSLHKHSTEMVCTPPRVDEYSTEVVYTPPPDNNSNEVVYPNLWINTPVRWCTRRLG